MMMTSVLANQLQRFEHAAHCYDMLRTWEEIDHIIDSHSSLSLNSAGLTVIIDTPPALSTPTSNETKTQNSLPSNLISSNTGSSNQCALDDSSMPGSLHHPLMISDPRPMIRGHLKSQGLMDSFNFNPVLMVPPSNQETDINSSLSWNRFIDGFDGPSETKLKTTRHYYKWKIGKLPHLKVRFDRLALLALLDRNLTLIETIFSIILAVSVAGLGLLLLQQGFYRDIFAFIFCLVTASCQYSLLKSVQPDAASPTHGFNRIIVFSRPIYFIICSGMILLFNESLKDFKSSDFTVYGIRVVNYDVILQARNGMLIFLLCFPILFSLGLFPQINTFLMYIFEHLDIHVFGGTATTGLVSSVYSLSRSVATVIILYGFAYGALSEPKSTQHIMFSIFIGLLVAISYHLSRSSSDPSVIWDIVKTNLWPPELYLEDKEAKVIENTSQKVNNPIERDLSKETKIKHRKKDVKVKVADQMSDSELVDPLPEKLKATVNGRLKNDLIVCTIIGILSFAIHSSTVFTALQPELNPVLWGIVSCLGFLLHYILPQLRKQLPWLCLAKPVLKSHEYAQFEVTEPVRIMWYERVYVCLCFLERNILYPLVFLAALTESSSKIVVRFGVGVGSVIVVVCGLKALRSAYADPSTRYIVLVFAVLLFKYDFQVSS